MDKINETLSYCGMDCGGCKNFKKNMNCQGCRYETQMLDDCPTRACAIKKGLLHCGMCPDFSCALLKEFYEDGACHHAQAYKNMLLIREEMK